MRTTNMKDERQIIWEHFQENGELTFALEGLMNYLDVDTLVAWFVDEGYVDAMSDEENARHLREFYDTHCC